MARKPHPLGAMLGGLFTPPPAYVKPVSPRDRDYMAAKDCAQRMLDAGEIVNYSTRTHPRMGRLIEIETDQGWDPNPLYQEYPDD